MYSSHTDFPARMGIRHQHTPSQEEALMLDSLSTPGRAPNSRTDSKLGNQQHQPQFKAGSMGLRPIRAPGYGEANEAPYSTSSEMSLQDRTSRWVAEHGATEHMSLQSPSAPQSHSYPSQDPSHTSSPAAGVGETSTGRQILQEGEVQVMEDIGLGLVGLQGVGQGVMDAPHLEQLQLQLREQVKELSNVTSLSITSDQLPNALLSSLAHQLVSLEVSLKLPGSSPGTSQAHAAAAAAGGEAAWEAGSQQGDGTAAGGTGTERDAALFARYRSAWAVTVQFLEQCTRLRSLTIDALGPAHPPTAVPSICRAVPLLEQVSLKCVMDTRATRALLAMKHLKDVTVFSFDDVDRSFADEPCRWERISHMSHDVSIRFLALLPLLSLKETLQYPQVEGEQAGSGGSAADIHLVLPRAANDDAGLQAVRAAALNVPPAFLSDVHIAGIKCDARGPQASETVTARMLETCKPLVQKPSDSITISNMAFGYEMVLAVSSLVNRFKLNRLQLHQCNVETDMWAHMLRTLPRLDQLDITCPVNTFTALDFERLHRALAGRPFTLNLNAASNLPAILPQLIRLTQSLSDIQLLEPVSGNTASDVVIAFNPASQGNTQERLLRYHAPRAVTAAATTHQAPPVIVADDDGDLSSCDDPFDYPAKQQAWEGEETRVDASWHKASYQAFVKKCEENLQLQSGSEDSLSDLDWD